MKTLRLSPDSFGAFSSYRRPSRQLEIHFRVERKLRFLRGVDSEEFVNVFMRIGFGIPSNCSLTRVKWLPLIANSFTVSGIVIATTAAPSFSVREKVFLGVLVKGERQDFGAKCGALTNKCGGFEELMQGEGPPLTVESQHTPIASPTISQPTTSQPMSSQEQPSQVPTTEPIITTSSPPLYETTIPYTTSSMPYDLSLSRGDTPESDEGSKKLNELIELCTKLFDKATSLEKDLKQTKKVYGKALTKLVNKVKHLEDKLKSTTERRKARMVISDDEEDLVLEDPSKQGRMTATEYEDVDVETEYEEAEYELDQTDTLQQITPIKVSQDAPRERVKTYKSYTRRRRRTVSSRDSTAGGLFSTAEEILSIDERMAQNLNEEEMAKAAAREDQEMIDFEKALELQKQLDEKEDIDDIDWNAIAEQVQEIESDAIKRYQTLKKKLVSVAQARKNMMIYLKNMIGYKMNYFKGMSYDKIRPIFEEEYNKIQTLFKKDTEVEKTMAKRVAEETLL
ncbi:hypothetical protein Tco_0508967 [Tanacetum coccineum]